MNTMMNIFTKDNILFILGSAFVGLTIISLIEIAYVVLVLERKTGALEQRLRKNEQNLSEYVMRTEALNHELDSTKLESLSNQCKQLAKNRLMRRELRVLLKKLTNREEQEQNT